MKNRYKLVLSNQNLYKEVELSVNDSEVRIGSNVDCQVRLRKELFFEPIELTLIRKGDGWTMLCSDNFYISMGDVRKLVSKDLMHGDSLSVNYQNSNSEALHIDYLVDFNDGQIKYERAINIQGANNIVIARGNFANISINSEYLTNDQIVLRRNTNGSYSIHISNTTYGVYINGKKASNGEVIKNGDFFSISDCFFYYKNNYFWTEKGNRIVSNSFKVYDNPNLNTYPKFVRNTRLKKVIDDKKIEILDPPVKPEKPRANLIMRLLPSIGMMAASAVMALMGGMMMLIFSGVSAVIAIITAVVGVVQDKKEFEKNTEDRITKYTNYITKKRTDIEWFRAKEKETLDDIFIASNEELSRFDNFSNKLFDRSKDDEDFLLVRLGSGELKARKEIDFKKKEKLEVEDDLQLIPEELYNAYKYLHNAPIVCDLKTVDAIGVVGALEQRYVQFKNIVFDLIARQHYNDLELFFIAEKEHKDYVRWMRMVPFLHNDELGVPNIVCDDESKNVIFEYLYKEFTARKEQKDKKFDRNIVIFFFDEYGFKSHPISKFLKDAKDLDVTFVFFADSIGDISNGCGKIISVSDNTKAMLLDSEDSKKNIEFEYLTISEDKARMVANMLAPVFTEDVSLEGSLTKNLSLFELLNIISVDDIDLSKNWEESKVYSSMSAPIGVSKTGVVSLDLHDKAHGPHGLVAGTTGSGKSEILQTYILSMVTLFHPYEVGFVIIDFKGGGMVNQFKDLPHLMGAITNIDGKAINRSLKSIKAELQKRQRLFAQVEVNHIDKYIKKYKQGEALEPLPHLIIIVDEFAELKAEQPEFMKELISAARIGRSLGVHLILATQKPSGQVNEQIWSNSRFKLCLKVQDKNDSNEVLKSPLAAEIKEPGRAYLQVGNNEIFDLFQSAYSGASDKADDSSQKEFSISEITESGKKVFVYQQKKEKSDDSKEGSTQLTAIVDYISKYCEDSNISKLPNICLPALENIVPFKTEEVKDNNSIIADIGVYDDPDNQYQGIYSINLSEQNVMVIGSTLSGKTNLLQTIIRSLSTKYSPNDVNMYVIDCASMVLMNFEGLHHIGGVVTISEDEKLTNLFKLLLSEIEVRKEKLLEAGVSSFSAYKEAGYTDIPHIVLLIDNLSVLKSTFFKDNDEMLVSLSRECISVGISIVIANPQTSGISYKYAANFSTKIAMFCNETSEYTNLFSHCKEKIDDIHGRSIIEINKEHYECQMFLSFEGEKEYQRVQEIKLFTQTINEKYPNCRAKIIPLIPEILTFDYIKDNYSQYTTKDNTIVVGLDYSNVEPYPIDFSRFGVAAITGREQSGKHNFIKYIIDAMNVYHHDQTEVYIIDGIDRKLQSYQNKENVALYDVLPQRAPSLLKRIESKLRNRYDNIVNGDENYLEKEKLILLVLNSEDVVEEISNNNECFVLYNSIVGKYKNMKVAVLLGNLENKLISYSSLEVYKGLRDNRQVFYFDDMSNLKLFDLPLSIQKQYQKPIQTGDCYYFIGNEIVKIKTTLASK